MGPRFNGVEDMDRGGCVVASEGPFNGATL